MANQYSNNFDHGDSRSHSNPHKRAYSASAPISRKRPRSAARTASVVFSTGPGYPLPPTPSTVNEDRAMGYFLNAGAFSGTDSTSSLDMLPSAPTSSDDVDFFPAFEQYISTDALRTPANSKAAEPSNTVDDEIDDIFGPSPGAVVQPLSSQPAPDQVVGPLRSDMSKNSTQSTSQACGTTSSPARSCFENVLCAALALYELDDSCMMVGSEALVPAPQNADQVLFRNREAIRAVRESLGCPCASEQDSIIASCLTLTKVLSWYDALIGEPAGSSVASHQANGSCDRVATTPIFVGTYKLDSRAQRSVLARVVLTELRDYVQPLLAKLSKHCVRGSSKAESGTRGQSTTLSAIGEPNCALRRQAKGILVKATSFIATT